MRAVSMFCLFARNLHKALLLRRPHLPLQQHRPVSEPLGKNWIVAVQGFLPNFDRLTVQFTRLVILALSEGSQEQHQRVHRTLRC